MRDFAKTYLCPDFTANNIGTQVWMGNFFTNNFANDVLPTLQDATARNLVRGAGIHRVANATMKQAMDTASAHNLHWHGMQDETLCWSGANNWTDAMNTDHYLDSFFICRTNSYMFWNMILNTNANFGWQSRAQNSLVTINTASNPKVVTYTGEFYVMKHWSYYIAQGAANIKVTNTNTNVQACGFKNPDGSIILELQNNAASTQSPVVQIGTQMFTPTLGATSVNTFIVGGNPDTHDWVPVTAVQSDAPPKRIVAGVTGTLGVYDMTGRLIKVLDRSSAKAEALWDRTDASGRKAAPGVYIIVDKAGNTINTVKILCK
jgi:hypothetical protein